MIKSLPICHLNTVLLTKLQSHFIDLKFMQIDIEFKKELSLLPDKEKDKLVLRLLRRDKKLAKRLHYELIGAFTKEDLQNDFFENVNEAFEEIKSYRFAPIHLSRSLRKLSSEIASYLFTTKDKHGQVWLNLYLLNKSFEFFSGEIDSHIGTEKGRKLAVYMINKTINTLAIIKKLDPDLYIDFDKELTSLGESFERNEGIAQMCNYHGFNISWLFDRNIPDNIDSIRKNLRSKGFLK